MSRVGEHLQIQLTGKFNPRSPNLVEAWPLEERSRYANAIISRINGTVDECDRDKAIKAVLGDLRLTRVVTSGSAHYPTSEQLDGMAATLAMTMATAGGQRSVLASLSVQDRINVFVSAERKFRELVGIKEQIAS